MQIVAQLSRKAFRKKGMKQAKKNRMIREGVWINMDKLFYEHLTRPGRFTLENLPIKN